MQYLLNEVQGKASTQTGDAKVFRTISDVMKHMTKINKDGKLMVGQEPLSQTRIESLLKERLSTVSISREGDGDKQWVVTAF